MKDFDIWLAVVLTAFAFFLLVNYAFAHSWYERSCCSDKDCGPVKYEEITEHPDGSISWRHCNWPAGDSRIKKSRDGLFHVCVAPLGPAMNSTGYCYCIYKPAPMF
jgi:hypothetical protein